jgi:hypothetical protein
VIITSVVIGSFLPPRVVAELELNSVNPPPDIVEEEKETKKWAEVNSLHRIHDHVISQLNA